MPLPEFLTDTNQDLIGSTVEYSQAHRSSYHSPTGTGTIIEVGYNGIEQYLVIQDTETKEEIRFNYIEVLYFLKLLVNND